MDEEYIDDVRENVDIILLKECVDKMLLNLRDREYKVLKLRFWDQKTLDQTGRELNISRERTRQIESKAIRKLRHPNFREEWSKIFPGCSDSLARREKERKLRLDAEWEIYRKEREERWKKERESQRKIHVTNIDELGFPREKSLPPKQVPAYKPKPSTYCPSIVILKFYQNGEAYLSTAPTHGYSADIKRERDPETYDRWLKQRLKEHTA